MIIVAAVTFIDGTLYTHTHTNWSYFILRMLVNGFRNWVVSIKLLWIHTGYLPQKKSGVITIFLVPTKKLFVDPHKRKFYCGLGPFIWD